MEIFKLQHLVFTNNFQASLFSCCDVFFKVTPKEAFLAYYFLFNLHALFSPSEDVSPRGAIGGEQYSMYDTHTHNEEIYQDLCSIDKQKATNGTHVSTLREVHFVYSCSTLSLYLNLLWEKETP